ncbi:MAG: 30S ribosomal protein S3ae [Thermoplasmata archaeon]|nr:MAG: 30S ribosomal protein S3ae [Thermoplasmata archaeon]
MAAKKASRTTARKVKDKWRSKEWYRVLAPDMFNNAQIAETLSDEREKIIGRVTEVTMQDLTGDFSKMHIKLQFKISEVSGFDAHTQFVGHTLTSDYIRRLTRRKHSKTDGVFDVLTKDKALIRVKPMAVTEKRIQVSQQQAIRGIMGKVISNEAVKNMHSEFVKEMLSGNMSKNILRACKAVYPLKRVEIRRSEVLRSPEEKVVEAPSEEERIEVEPVKSEELLSEGKVEMEGMEDEPIPGPGVEIEDHGAEQVPKEEGSTESEEEETEESEESKTE